MIHNFRYIQIVRSLHRWVVPQGFATPVKVNCALANNTLVQLRTRNNRQLTWYTCGPTVYDSAHIGHAVCYVKIDIIQRILRQYFGLNLVTVMNITDIDDKIINRSHQLNVDWRELATKYETEFFTDLRNLNVSPPNRVVRVTHCIPQIIEFITALINDGSVYVGGDGSTYFDVQRYGSYGKLHPIETGVGQVEEAAFASFKKNVTDFVVWKAAKPGEPSWDAPFGKGRPGWHIECSAIASGSLGSTIDVHAGGVDLRFPHHENEEAQSCAYFKQHQWVNYWIHIGHLITNSTKMSKSLKNTLSIGDFLRDHSANAFRMACLTSSYRNQMEYSAELLRTAKSNLETFTNFWLNYNNAMALNSPPSLDNTLLLKHLMQAEQSIQDSLAADFDTAKVIKTLNGLVTITNRMMFAGCSDAVTTSTSTYENLIATANLVSSTLGMLGIDLSESSSAVSAHDKSAELMDALVSFRHRVRISALENKDRTTLEYCDALRDNVMSKCGMKIVDKKSGSYWSRC